MTAVEHEAAVVLLTTPTFGVDETVEPITPMEAQMKERKNG